MSETNYGAYGSFERCVLPSTKKEKIAAKQAANKARKAGMARLGIESIEEYDRLVAERKKRDIAEMKKALARRPRPWR